MGRVTGGHSYTSVYGVFQKKEPFLEKWLHSLSVDIGESRKIGLDIAIF